MENNLIPGENKAEGAHLSFWRYLVTIILVVGAMIMAQIGLFGVAYAIEGNLDIMAYPPITLLWLSMLPFGAALVVLLLSVRFIHKLSIKSIFSGHQHFQWKTLFYSALLWFGLAAISDIVLSLLQPGNYQFVFNAGTFIPFLLVSLLLIPIQISAEETFFRGYLQPAFARVTKLWWVAILLQAALFGLLHGANTEVSEYGILTTMPFYIGIGILLGLITYRFNGLEAALGLHLANNLYASIAVTFAGSSIESPALFVIKNYQPVAALVVFAITAVIYFLMMNFILKKNGN